MKVAAIIKILEELAPKKLAEDWDNVGLLIEPSKVLDVKNIMLTIDLTESVLSEALNKNCNFIISYHPLIFNRIKRLTQGVANSRIIMGCIKNSICVYSPHTSWDSINDGVNDWIVNCLEYDVKQLISPSVSDPSVGMGRVVHLKKPMSPAAITEVFKKHFLINDMRLASPKTRGNRTIKTVAVCAGSGGSVLRGVDADMYVTGEMSHHEVLAAVAEGRYVLLSEHTVAERGFLQYISPTLTKLLQDEVNIIVSQNDMNPIEPV